MQSKYKKVLENRKGVAGLNVLLSVVTMLFMIGLLIMIYALVGGELKDQDVMYDSVTGHVDNETFTLLNATGNVTQFSTERSISLSNLVMKNGTVTVVAANYTISGGTITGTAITYDTVWVNVTYDYAYLAVGEAVKAINGTIASLVTAVDWFDIIIVLTAVIVLILLAVIIIRAIQGSGLMGGESGGKSEESA